MRRLLTTALAGCCALLAGRHVSLAQDSPPPPPPPEKPAAEQPAKAAESDPAALALLQAAAERQGGASLAAPGALGSFHVEFRALKVWRHVQNDDGGWTSANEPIQELDIDWMRNPEPGEDSSLRTYWERDGQKVWRCVNAVRGVFWLSDGQTITPLAPGTHDADREEVVLHRRLCETLLDVAVLHKMRTDGSIWTRVEDVTYDGPALRRVPGPGKTGLRFTIWLDPETKDPHHVRVEPVEEGAPVMHYELVYQDGLDPRVFSVEGAELRFPRKVLVRESYDDVPLRMVMEMFVKRVVFNAVEESVFAPKSTLGQ